MRARLTQVKAEADGLKKAGAEDMGARQRDIPVLRESANRWTDNLFVLKKQMVEKFNVRAPSGDRAHAPRERGGACPTLTRV